MKILVDADACPVKEIIVKTAKGLGISVIMFFDTSHVYSDGYSEVIIVEKGRDSVDFALANKICANDIVVTQDYGVAAMALSKRAASISQNGLEYDNSNIDKLLFERFLSQKARRSGSKTSSPKKRTRENDIAFETRFLSICKRQLSLSLPI